VSGASELVARSTCAALALTCSDFRFKATEQAFLRAAGLTDEYDLIARPGAARLIAAPRNDASRSTLLDEIALLWSVHHFPRILLVNHMSCRAYDDIITPATEVETHSAHLRAAAAGLALRYTDTSVETYLVQLTADRLEVLPVPRA